MDPKILQKIMLKLDIQKCHHAKIQIIWQMNGILNKINKLDKKWCDTHCHTSIDHIISQHPEMQKSQTPYQKINQDV
jgi:hypothetical protein